jgi:hypothetical protein
MTSVKFERRPMTPEERLNAAKKQAIAFACDGSVITSIQESFYSPVYSTFDVIVYRALVDGNAHFEVRVLDNGYTNCIKISGHPLI